MTRAAEQIASAGAGQDVAARAARLHSDWARHPIDDWSAAGRRRLVEEHGDRIRLLLDLAFTEFQSELGSYGFRGADPVDEAVTFVLKRFAEGDLDVGRVPRERRNFSIFTQPRFWLAQRLGRGYASVLAAEPRPAAADPDQQPAPAEASPGAVARREEARARVERKVARALAELRQRTCADLVTLWLIHTERLRAEWFDWPEARPASEGLLALSKKNRSLARHDALFRHLCLLHEIVAPHGAGGAPEAEAAALARFSACENRWPYQVPPAEVETQLNAKPTAPVRRLILKGTEMLLRRLLDVTAGRRGPRDPGTTVGSLLEAGERDLVDALSDYCLGLTTLHALGLKDRQGYADLRDALAAREATWRDMDQSRVLEDDDES